MGTVPATVKYWQRCQALLQWGEYQPDTKEFQVQRAPPMRNLKSQLKWIHRAGQGADVFFIANSSLTVEGEALSSFEASGRRPFDAAQGRPELWDAVWGTHRDLPEYEVKDGKTLVPIKFAPGQSWFVVFREKAPGKTTDDRLQTTDSGSQARPSKGEGTDGRSWRAEPATPKNFPELRPVMELAGPWEVQFDPKWGGPTNAVTFDALTDWTSNAVSGVKYYSGTATYRKMFNIESAVCSLKSTVYLALGEVLHIARVRLNGRDLGVVWCAPWQAEIPAGLLKAKGNQIEIEVTNTWRNRLIGDEQEPADCEFVPCYGQVDSGEVPARFYLKSFPDWFVKGQPRPSKGRYCFTTYNYFRKDSPLQPSGLLGPVRVMSVEAVAVP